MKYLGVLWFAMLTEFFILMTLHSANVGIPFMEYIRYSLEAFLPLYAIYLTYYAFHTHTWWKHFFSYKAWIVPAMALIVFSFAEWQLNPALYSQTEILGLSWQWVAIIEWTALFIVQLVLYQRRKVDLYIGFALSYLGVQTASHLYELPLFYAGGTIFAQYLAFPFTKLLVPVAMIATLYGLKRSFSWKWVVFTVPFVVMLPLFSFVTESAAWAVRLGTFPLFMGIPLCMGERNQ